MEENNNMTAERSLEIITEQIERSRKEVAKDTGLSLYIAGLCIMGVALFVGICELLTNKQFFKLLYIGLPVVIYFANQYAKRNKPKVPASFVGSMVSKTWRTFWVFAISFYVFSTLYNYYIGQVGGIDLLMSLAIHPFRILLLLMGMAITINGYTLKSPLMVWCGIIGGIGGFIWEAFSLSSSLVTCFLSPSPSLGGIINGLLPAIIIALFAFIGLTLPGMILKKKCL